MDTGNAGRENLNNRIFHLKGDGFCQIGRLEDAIPFWAVLTQNRTVTFAIPGGGKLIMDVADALKFLSSSIEAIANSLGEAANADR